MDTNSQPFAGFIDNKKNMKHHKHNQTKRLETRVTLQNALLRSVSRHMQRAEPRVLLIS